jgi:transposase
MDNIRLIGIDTAKNVFQFACANHAGKVVLKKRIWREALMCFMSKLPREAVIVMEACGGSHHWGRTFQKLGFKVKLIAPQLVSPYRKSQKSDAADAVAIVEAARSHEMRFVDIKTEQQQ